MGRALAHDDVDAVVTLHQRAGQRRGLVRRDTAANAEQYAGHQRRTRTARERSLSINRVEPARAARHQGRRAQGLEPCERIGIDGREILEFQRRLDQRRGPLNRALRIRLAGTYGSRQRFDRAMQARRGLRCVASR